MTIAASAALSLYLPVNKGDALIAGGLLFPVIWVVAMTLVYAARSNKSALLGLALSSAGFVVLYAAKSV